MTTQPTTEPTTITDDPSFEEPENGTTRVTFKTLGPFDLASAWPYGGDWSTLPPAQWEALQWGPDVTLELTRPGDMDAAMRIDQWALTHAQPFRDVVIDQWDARTGSWVLL